MPALRSGPLTPGTSSPVTYPRRRILPREAARVARGPRALRILSVIEMLEHGLRGAFGGRDESLEKVEGDLVLLSDTLPLCEEGPVDLAASFAWGARALADAEGHPFPARNADRFYGLMPRPPGSHRDWVAKLVGPGGLTPQELVQIIRANPQPDDLPDGQEIVILTDMRFAIPSARVAVSALRRAAPEFCHEGRNGGADVFTWTRPYPKGHWNPLSSLGGRQVLGTVRVSGRELVADAKTLSNLEGSRWMGLQDLLARERGSGGSSPLSPRAPSGNVGS